jgi:hypothetical protein
MTGSGSPDDNRNPSGPAVVHAKKSRASGDARQTPRAARRERLEVAEENVR